MAPSTARGPIAVGRAALRRWRQRVAAAGGIVVPAVVALRPVSLRAEQRWHANKPSIPRAWAACGGAAGRRRGSGLRWAGARRDPVERVGRVQAARCGVGRAGQIRGYRGFERSRQPRRNTGPQLRAGLHAAQAPQRALDGEQHGGDRAVSGPRHADSVGAA